jgi:hypothetical protein
MYKRAIRRKLKAGEVVNFKVDDDAADALNYLRTWARNNGGPRQSSTVSDLVRWAIRRAAVQTGWLQMNPLDAAANSREGVRRCREESELAPTAEQPPQGDDCD